jgi:heme oxygenase
MITERLKTETAQLHKETEDVSYGALIMSGALTPAEYAIIIEKNYILHAVLEQAFKNYAPLAEVEGLDIESRYKTNSLIADMQLIGRELPKLPNINITLNSLEEALGMMYVLEGATLGGSYILKALLRTPSMQSITSYNYYGVYGDTIGPKWKTFQQILLSNVDTKEKEDVAIAAAAKTYQIFKDVFVGGQAAI